MVVFAGNFLAASSYYGKGFWKKLYILISFNNFNVPVAIATP